MQLRDALIELERLIAEAPDVEPGGSYRRRVQEWVVGDHVVVLLRRAHAAGRPEFYAHASSSLTAAPPSTRTR